MPPPVSFAAGWTMVLSYAIVCPWEAVATGNLLARVFPVAQQLSAVRDRRQPDLRAAARGRPRADGADRRRQLPRHQAERHLPGRDDVRAAGDVRHLHAARLRARDRRRTCSRCSRAGAQARWLSIFLVLQIVPYFMTGFESVAKGSEEAQGRVRSAQLHARRSTRRWSPAFSSTCIIIAVVTYVYPWQEIVSGHVRTEVAFERTFGSHAIAQLILFGAFLSLLKIFNGNFVAATRMLYAIGRRNLVHPSLGRVHARFGTPVVAIGADGGADRRGGDVRRRDPGADHRSRIAGGRRRLALGLRRLPRAARRDGYDATNRRRWPGSARPSASRSS